MTGAKSTGQYRPQLFQRSQFLFQLTALSQLILPRSKFPLRPLSTLSLGTYLKLIWYHFFCTPYCLIFIIPPPLPLLPSPNLHPNISSQNMLQKLCYCYIWIIKIQTDHESSTHPHLNFHPRSSHPRQYLLPTHQHRSQARGPLYPKFMDAHTQNQETLKRQPKCNL